MSLPLQISSSFSLNPFFKSFFGKVLILTIQFSLTHKIRSVTHLFLSQAALCLFGRLFDDVVFAINRDYRFGANQGAHRATHTVAIRSLGGEIAAFVGFFGDNDAASRANAYAKTATFASLEINCYFASHPVYLVVYSKTNSNSRGGSCKEKTPFFRGTTLWKPFSIESKP